MAIRGSLASPMLWSSRPPYPFNARPTQRPTLHVPLYQVATSGAMGCGKTSEDGGVPDRAVWTPVRPLCLYRPELKSKIKSQRSKPQIKIQRYTAPPSDATDLISHKATRPQSSAGTSKAAFFVAPCLRVSTIRVDECLKGALRSRGLGDCFVALLLAMTGRFPGIFLDGWRWAGMIYAQHDRRVRMNVKQPLPDARPSRVPAIELMMDYGFPRDRDLRY